MLANFSVLTIDWNAGKYRVRILAMGEVVAVCRSAMDAVRLLRENGYRPKYAACTWAKA